MVIIIININNKINLIYFILFYFILYFILFYFILFYFYFILFYFILFYFILFYFILFYFILFYFLYFYSWLSSNQMIELKDVLNKIGFNELKYLLSLNENLIINYIIKNKQIEDFFHDHPIYIGKLLYSISIHSTMNQRLNNWKHKLTKLYQIQKQLNHLSTFIIINTNQNEDMNQNDNDIKMNEELLF